MTEKAEQCSNDMAELIEKIRKKEAVIGVIGLGYVGYGESN